MKKPQRIAAVLICVTCIFSGWRLVGQIHDQSAAAAPVRLHGLSPQELELLRHDIRQQKQKLIAQNLPMTESEAIKFWAVYQKYSNELKEINDEKFGMMHSYSQNWRSMSNDDALIFMRRWLEVDEKMSQLRSKYLPLVREALPGKKAATFFQLDERIGMMIDLEFADQLPLLHGAPPRTTPGSPPE